ncbi:condensation domain-containing protein, partial [Streptomyces mirabilis]
LEEAGEARPALAVRERPERVPLSYAQQRLWFIGQLEGPSPTYNSPVMLRLSGGLDRSALAAAFRDVLGRHEALRTVFPAADGQPYQQVVPLEELAWELAVVDIAGADRSVHPDLRLLDLGNRAWDLPATDGSVIELSVDLTTSSEVAPGELVRAAAEAAGHAFDLSAEVPVRAWLFGAGAGEHVLVVVVHHIAGDGWSTGPLMRDLSAAYAARCAGRVPEWAPLPVQYADYALWQRELLGSDGDAQSLMSRQINYWREALGGSPEELALPFDRPRPAMASHRGHTATFRVPAQLHERLLEVARAEGVTLFMILQTALSVLLSRLGAGTDVPIGSAVAGRTDEALDDLVGCFVNSLVVRTDLSGDPTFGEVLGRVRERALAAFAHQDVPFERLVEALAPSRSLARHPLFQVVLTALDSGSAVPVLPDVESRAFVLGKPVAKFDLDVLVGEVFDETGAPAGVRGAVSAAADLFDEPFAGWIAGRFVRVLEVLAGDVSTRVSGVEVLDEAERRRVLV